MIFKATAAEQKQAQAIKDSYDPELERLRIALRTAQDKEERKSILIKLQATLDSLQAELDSNLDKVQRKHFKKIAQGGTDAIMKHAKEQLPLILANVHEIASTTLKHEDALKLLGVGSRKSGELILNANYATQALKDELYLHIEALKDNKDALRELLEAIIEAVEASPLTDNAEIVEGQPLEVKRFRRNPLGDIIKFGIMNDKVSAQMLQDGDIFQQQANGQLTLRWAIDQAPAQKVPVYVALTYEGDGNAYKVNKRLTGFDKQVLEAVATRFYYWQKENPQKPLYITPQEIWRTMNGKSSSDGKAKPSPAQVKRICDSIDKMRFTRFYMDISAEIEAFNLSIDDERITSGHIETYVLNCSKVVFNTEKGSTIQGYRIGEEPILFTYNKAKKHLLYVPYEMLDTSDFTSDSENVTEFKGYLLQQIQLIKNGEEGKGKRFKRSSTILLETIYEATGVLPPEERTSGYYANEATRQQIIRRNRATDLQKIVSLLDAWKAKGHIKNYVVLNQKNEPIKEKQQAKSIRISV